MSEDNKSEPMAWPKPKNRDAELDEALRELGDDLLDEEVPERLVRILRSARQGEKKDRREQG